MAAGDPSGGGWHLAGTTPAALRRDDHAVDEQLTAPDPAGLPPLEGAGQARRAHRALEAQGFGDRHLGGVLGEEDTRVTRPAGEVVTQILQGSG
jgi:hypothetical protein